MEILVTGANGQLGNELRKFEKTYEDINFYFTDVNELDITSPNALNVFFEDKKIDFIINCAAYTAVDKAEEDQEMAIKLNVTALEHLSIISKQSGATLIHISTDYIFDGKNHKPYVEGDFPSPQSFYGHTKATGEQVIYENAKRAVIIRTSWLYSEFGNNFVKTMMRLGSERNELKVIVDQIGTPTYAYDLADVILKLILNTESFEGIKIYHFSNEGIASWYDFAREIMIISNLKCDVLPIESKDYPLPAPRPFYSVLNKSKIKKDLNFEIPHWKEALTRCISSINENR